MENAGHGGALGVPQRSSYLQYKRNTSALIRWVVTTAATCNLSCGIPKSKNNNPQNKKKVARAVRAAEDSALTPEISVARLVSLSTAIAEAGEAVPEAIFALFDSVIRARIAAYECFKDIWTQSQDEDIREINERRFTFITALQEAFDTLGGAAWNERRSQEAKNSRNTKKSLKVKDVSAAQESESVTFLNQFRALNVEDVPSEDEEEVAELVKPDIQNGDSTAGQESGASKAKRKGKGKKKKPTTQPLENFKFTSDTEIYYAVCFFARDFLELRRYTQNLWKEVGLGQIKCVVAGALSELATGMVKSLQFELATDYPGCVHYRGIINQLVRNEDPEVEEEMLLNTHDDLAFFITEFRKDRSGKVSPAFKGIRWDPNFRAL